MDARRKIRFEPTWGGGGGALSLFDPYYKGDQSGRSSGFMLLLMETILQHCLAPVRHFSRLSRSMHFDDVSEAKAREFAWTT